MKIILMMLVLTVGTFAQEFVGTAKGVAFYVALPVRTGTAIKFIGITTPYKIIDNKIALDEENYLLTSFTGDCVTYEYTPKSYLGKIKGEEVNGTFDLKPAKAEKESMIFGAMTIACRQKTLKDVLQGVK